jgi:hypothetical protein
MPGPRKNLTPLDMKMLGLAYNQGGIINFLGKQPEVTAPIRAQSHADAPATQLAYITDAEKDLLVNANIHGSMDGKPNPGPAGLPSLDDFYMVPDSSKPGGYSIAGGGGSTGGGPSIDVYTAPNNPNQYTGPQIGAGDAVTYDPKTETGGNVISGSGSEDSGSGDTTTTTTTTEQTDAQKEAAKAKKPEDLLKILQDKALGQQALTEKQLNIIVGLLSANQKNDKVLTKEEEGAFSNLFDENRLEQFVENYRVNYPNYFEDKTPGTLGGAMGILDSVTAGDFRDDKMNVLGLGDEVGSFTLQGLDKALSSAEKRYLKEFRPDLFYGTSSVPGFGAQTSGGLADLASLDASKYEESNPDFANRIFAARADLDRMGKDMFGNTQGSANQGGGGGTYVPPTTTPDDPMIPQDPTLPPGVTPPATTPKFPGSVITDYTQLGLPNIYGNQQMPNYANFYQGQGGQPVGLQDYLDNLRKRFGIG